MDARPHFFFTVDVEEWFTSTRILSLPNAASFQASSDIEETMQWLICFLREEKLLGTFFFIQNIAERYPWLIKTLIREGHEVALHGITHEDLRTLSPQIIDKMLEMARIFFQTQFNLSLKGYRAPYFSITKEALILLKKHNFIYDSSIVPSLPIPGWYGMPTASKIPYRISSRLTGHDSRGYLFEYPMSVHPRLRLPGLGGYYFRNLGYRYTHHLASQCLKKLNYAMFYLHPWELSPSIPNIQGVPFYMRRRTGTWTKEALRDLMRSIRNTFNPLYPTLSDFCQRNIHNI